MSGTGTVAPLKPMTDVRDVTRRSLICESLEINASVMPSEKNSCDGSPDRFWSGSTAIDEIRPRSFPERHQAPAAVTISSPVTVAAAIIHQRKRGAPAALAACMTDAAATGAGIGAAIGAAIGAGVGEGAGSRASPGAAAGAWPGDTVGASVGTDSALAGIGGDGDASGAGPGVAITRSTTGWNR